MYLCGELERGINPADSTWTHGGGTGEGGVLLQLAKLNLELLQRPWQHSESWWPRLLAQHPLVAWDDGQCQPLTPSRALRACIASATEAGEAFIADAKDYSDLPEPVMALHQVSARPAAAAPITALLLP